MGLIRRSGAGGLAAGPALPSHDIRTVMICLKFVIFAALALQVIAVGIQDATLTRAVMLFTYPLLIFVALVNWRLVGMRLFFGGALLNFVVMAANGGLMPVSAHTVATVSGRTVETIPAEGPVPGTKSVVMPEDEIVLGALADRLVIDLPVISPKVVSVGDIMIATGLTLATVQVLTRIRSPVFAENRHA